MRSKQLYREFEVNVVSVDSEMESVHKHNFFQLIYVLEGSGIHIVNDNRFHFSKGDVFLLTPKDAHSYEIVIPPVFCIIDFTKTFFYKPANIHNEKVDFSEAFRTMEYVFQNQNHMKGNMIMNNDEFVFETLIKQLIAEKENEKSFSKIIIQNIIFLLLNFIARNIQQERIVYSLQDNQQSKIYEITSYLQQYIYDKKLLTIRNLAKQFNLSEGHLSRYFKQQTSSTLKHYITSYKLDIVKTRLKFSELTISEIAAEMNFTDESHLNKVFKKAFGVTAKQFKLDHTKLPISIRI